MKLWKFIKESILKNPNQKICENQAYLSFEETAIWAENFANKLLNINCCAILCSSEIATAMSLLACFAAGVTAVPLSIRYGEGHCNKILDSINPDAIIMDTNGEIAVYRIKDSQYIVPKEHPALIMCTSGTTGEPKGVMLSEHNIITNVSDITEYFEIDDSDTILISRPLYHCAVLTGEFLTAIVKGSRIRFYSKQFNPTKMLALIKEFEITAFCGTPTLLSIMARFNRGNTSDSLRFICVSGECMGSEVGLKIKAAFPNCNIYHVYGLTEASPRVCYMPSEYFEEYPDYVGLPLRSVSVKILSDNNKPCVPGEEGVLWVKGENVMLGYYNDAERTQSRVKDGWLCTEDFAVMNDLGFIKIKGRTDDLIIKAGMNIYPAEIESVLKQDPRVMDVIAYGVHSEIGTHIGIKIVGDFSSIGEVKQLCLRALPSFQIPAVIDLVNKLPQNSSGKIIRNQLNKKKKDLY